MELDRPSPEAPLLSARLSCLAGRGMRLDLTGVRETLAALGHPDRAYPILLVGGSNGKGTTAFLAAEALAAQGISVGLLTSPHLVDPRERVLLRFPGGATAEGEAAWGMPSERDLLDDLDAVLAAGPDATYYEAMLLAGLRHLSRAGVRAAVLEVGLGGRLDATNATGPLVSAVASLSLEHTDILGSTIELIAREKAAIARPGRPFLAPAAFLTDLARPAEEIGARLRPAQDFEGDLAMEGPSARADAGLALAAARALFEEAGLAFDEAAARREFSRATWPGRLERIRVEGEEWVLDAAHNPAAAASLALSLETPVVLLAGFLRDKDSAEILRALAPRAREIVLTRVPEAGARAADPAEVARAWGGAAHALPDAEEALAFARTRAAETGLPLLITGSIYLVGWTLRWIGRMPFPERKPLA